MVYLHAHGCGNCRAKGIIGAEACGTCHGIGYMPVNKETLADMALTLTWELPGGTWVREKPAGVEFASTLIRLKAIEAEYYRLKGNSFPV